MKAPVTALLCVLWLSPHLLRAEALPAPAGKKIHFSVPQDKISLEGCLMSPDGKGPFPAVVVCHPDPRMGGSMDNPVVTALTEALTRSGYTTLRFDFRGVGNSEGRYGNKTGEQKDAEAAIECLRQQEQVNAAALFLAGYSFGAGISLQVAVRNSRVRGLACVACPNDYAPATDAKELPNGSVPMLFVGGVDDPWCKLGSLEEALRKLHFQAQYRSIDKTDHFFRSEDALSEAADEVVKFFNALMKR
jgi:alpha/beta superfamily hydrolase